MKDIRPKNYADISIASDCQKSIFKKKQLEIGIIRSHATGNFPSCGLWMTIPPRDHPSGRVASLLSTSFHPNPRCASSFTVRSSWDKSVVNAYHSHSTLVQQRALSPMRGRIVFTRRAHSVRTDAAEMGDFKRVTSAAHS